MASLFWPDSEEAQALSNLRNLLTRAKQFFPDIDRYVRTSRTTLQWAAETPLQCDVHELEACLRREPTLEVVERALELYREDLLPACYDEWIAPERERLRGRFKALLDDGIQRLEAERHYATALRCAHRRLELDALNEATYLSLMRLYAATGNRPAALHVYKTCVETLQRELQTRPGRALRTLHQQLLDVDANLQATAVHPRPFVGRTAEWTQLQTLWAISATGVAQAVSLVGEVGIGKTRMLEEYMTWAASQGISVASARCYGVEGRLAFAPVISLIRSCMPRQLAPVWRSELARLLPEFGAASILTLPDFPGEPWQRQRLFEALARAILASQPVLVAIDDLHWCDRDSLEWLHFLLRFDPTARLQLVTTMRLEESEAAPTATSLLDTLDRNQRLTRIHLPRLDAATTARLAAELIGRELEPRLARRLYQETEGNCLFIVELAREQLLEPDASGTSPLPSTLETLLRMRLARLSPEACGLAELAAVVGRAFTMDELEAISGSELRVFLETLDELQRHGILRDQDGGLLDFSHTLLSQFTYAQQRSARRRMRHLQVAQALERLPSPAHFSLSGEIASHYEKGGMVANAASHYLRAADAARRVEAYLVAAEFYSAALRCLEREDRLELRWAALSGREQVFEASGDLQAVSGDLLTMEQLAVRHHDDAWLATVRNRQSYVAYSLGDPAAAVQRAERARDLARTAADPLIEATACFNLSTALCVIATENPDRILEAQQSALSLIRHGAAPLLEGQLLAQSAFTYCLMNRPEEARASLDSALHIARELGNRRAEASALYSLACVHQHTHSYDEAIAALERAAALAREISVRTDCITYEGLLGQWYALCRWYREALAHFSAAFELARSLEMPWGECVWLSHKGFLLHELGDEQGAFTLQERALDIALRLDTRRFERGVLYRLAITAVDFGQPERGLEFAERAMKLHLPSDRIFPRYEESCLLYALGVAQAASSRWEEALEPLERAWSMGTSSTDLRSPSLVQSACMALAEIDLARGNPQSALKRLELLILELDAGLRRMQHSQRALFAYSRALEGVGEHQASRARLVRAGQVIQETADRLRGTPYHATYLEGVVLNRQILSLLHS